MKELKQLIEKLNKHKKELYVSGLAYETFQTECQKVYEGILKEIRLLSDLVIKKNASSKFIYTFEIHNVGSVSINIVDTDFITLIEEQSFDTDLSVKVESYKFRSSKFDECSLTYFKRAIERIEYYNQLLKQY